MFLIATLFVLRANRTGQEVETPHPRGICSQPFHVLPAAVTFNLPTCTVSGVNCISADKTSTGPPKVRAATSQKLGDFRIADDCERVTSAINPAVYRRVAAALSSNREGTNFHLRSCWRARSVPVLGCSASRDVR